MQVGLSSGVQKNPERRGHRPLLDWLRYLRTRRGAGDYTHLCMDGAFGGMLTVPPQLETEFLQKYAEEIDAGSAFSAEQATSRMYICESKTPFFKFFVDVDFSLADPLYYVAADKKKVVCRVVSIVVKSFFAGLADDAFIMMVADTSSFEGAPAPEEEQGDPAHGPLVRVGGRARSSNMHVHFPSLVGKYLAPSVTCWQRAGTTSWTRRSTPRTGCGWSGPVNAATAPSAATRSGDPPAGASAAA
jgi:hypothetical protein